MTAAILHFQVGEEALCGAQINILDPEPTKDPENIGHRGNIEAICVRLNYTYPEDKWSPCKACLDNPEYDLHLLARTSL